MGNRFTDNPGLSFRTAREGESPAFATKGDAAQRGFFRGVTFNVIDELNAVARAGGLDPKDEDGGRALAALVKGAYRLFGGDQDAVVTYRVEAGKQREASKRLEEQQPGASLAGEVVGAALTIPFAGGAGAVARGATVVPRMAQGAKAGAAYGGSAERVTEPTCRAA